MNRTLITANFMIFQMLFIIILSICYHLKTIKLYHIHVYTSVIEAYLNATILHIISFKITLKVNLLKSNYQNVHFTGYTNKILSFDHSMDTCNKTKGVSDLI